SVTPTSTMSAMNDSATTTEKKAGVFSPRSVNPNGRERDSKVETEPTGPPKSVLREYFESAIVTVIMALFGMTFIVQAVKVPTGSMLNTILVGDHLLVNKFIFGKDGMMIDKVMPHRLIRRGDIIVFKYPKDPTTNYVKRVIGLPGETIEVKGTHVYINGQELPEQRLIAEQHLTQQRLPDNDAPLDVVGNQDGPVEGAV